MQHLGCFVFDDFNLSTRGGTYKLSVEDTKHFLKVDQTGTVKAFYGDAIFPESVPRLWSINYENDRNKEFLVRAGAD